MFFMIPIPLILLFLLLPALLGMIGIGLLFPEFKEKKVKKKHN